MPFRTLDGLDAAGKRVLLRADLNVPVRDGRITDLTRIERLTPTIKELSDKGARVIVCSHFDRPKGKRVPEMSLAPVATALGQVLGKPVRFAEDCTGVVAEQAVMRLNPGEVLVLENTRYHAAEEKNDPEFAKDLAKLADVYVNDAFSAAHRAHASTEGVARLLPAYAGRLMQAELEALHAALDRPERPVAAMFGGVILGVCAEGANAMINSQASDWFPFIVLVIILIFSPRGLFSSSSPLMRLRRPTAARV
ncbi:MAG: phosphoglycerate kinase [Rhodospirillales bacterium]|nr:phosphoglycerate kinase [Rhodospirillales bacterium]